MAYHLQILYIFASMEWHVVTCIQLMLFVCSVSFVDPVAVRHSLEIVCELAAKDPYAVAMALGN